VNTIPFSSSLLSFLFPYLRDKTGEYLSFTEKKNRSSYKNFSLKKSKELFISAFSDKKNPLFFSFFPLKSCQKTTSLYKISNPYRNDNA
jgi:hypothetical protein